MPTIEENRSRRTTRLTKKPRASVSSVEQRSASSPQFESEEHAQVICGDRVTHVIVPIEEYEELVKADMELELVTELEGKGIDPFDDPNVEWVDAEQFALQLAADRIVQARKARKMTQKQLAEKLGVPQSQISRIERNPDRTTVRTLKRIAKALNADIRSLIS